jgi:HD superfamily phosphodiesterase
MSDYSEAEKYILEKLKAELSPQLQYHGIHHTYDVLEASVRIAAAENLPEEDVKLLRVAVCFHDAGFLKLYKGHEEIGCEMVRDLLPSYGFSDLQIEKICGMIMATHLPQQPHTLPERIIADADLDYLGRDDFYLTGETLYEEFRIYLGVKDEKEWNEIQLKFLRGHHYHTAYSQKLRGVEKEKRISEIEALVDSYST